MTRRLRPQLVEAAGDGGGVDADRVAELRKVGSFFWLDLCAVPPERTAGFAAALGLEEAAASHLLDGGQRPSFTESDDGIHLVSYGLRDESTPDPGTELSQVRGVYMRSFLVTAHDQACRGLDDARRRYERLRYVEQDDGPLVLFMVLDALVNTFESVLPRLETQLDRLESDLLAGRPKPGYVHEIAEIRGVLTPIIRGLAPYRRDLVSILGDVDRLPGMQSGSQRYFDSHRTHVTALLDAANGCREETRDAMEAFGSATSERQGEVINWLTMVTAVFLPLTFVTGYFGMNFSVITRLHGTRTFSLLAIVLPSVLAVFSVVLLRFLIHRLGVRLIPSRHPQSGSG
jgi:Mg2+ and Co2+ transporter CorA